MAKIHTPPSKSGKAPRSRMKTAAATAIDPALAQRQTRRRLGTHYANRYGKQRG
jgi:hypothetical protein